MSQDTSLSVRASAPAAPSAKEPPRRATITISISRELGCAIRTRADELCGTVSQYIRTLILADPGLKLPRRNRSKV